MTVLRDGQRAAAEPTAKVTEAELIHHMVGREVADKYPHTPAADRPVGLRVDHLSAPGIEDISFEAHEGEVLGFAGLMGAGGPELGRTLYGAPFGARWASIELEVAEIVAALARRRRPRRHAPSCPRIASPRAWSMPIPC